MDTKTKLMAAVIVIAIAASAYSLLTLNGGETTPTGKPEAQASIWKHASFTLPAGPGSWFAYTSMVAYFSENGSIVNDTTTFNLTIVDVTWPVATINYTVTDTNRTGVSMLIVTNTQMPLELLGSSRVSVPVTIPFANDSFCVNLTLTRESNSTLMYTGVVEAGSITVRITLEYNAESGVLVRSNTSIYDAGRLLFRHEQVLHDYSPSSRLTVDIDEWLCSPPLSSNIMLVWEGVMLLEGTSAKPVDIAEVRDAMASEAIVAVFYKDGRELTNRLWKSLLEVSAATGKQAYVIVIGPMTPRDVQIFASSLLAKYAVEGNVVILFRNGEAVAKVYSYGSTEDLVSLFEEYGAGGAP